MQQGVRAHRAALRRRMEARTLELEPSLLQRAPGREREGRYSGALAQHCTEHASSSSSRGCKRHVWSMSGDCMELSESSMHALKSRNFGSIHPAPRPGV
eukprot:3476618-Alexandrium_andersonii.AAC.1